MTAARIIVGSDGSEHAARAVQWCADHAAALDAEVVLVHAAAPPTYTGFGPPYIWLTSLTPEQRAEREALVTREWCKPLADAGVEFRVEVIDGEPAPVLMDAARAENAAFVVVGRRGRGGFKELLLGSTSHHLAHHLDRPLVLVP